MLSKNLISGKCYRDGAEITAEEYSAALEEIKAKAAWVDKICTGSAVIEDVPEEWQEEIRGRAAERQAEDTDPDLTDAEALAIILGGAE